MATSSTPGQPLRRARDERGFAFPSPLVMFSIIAIAMAGFAFVATQDDPALERRIESAATSPSPSATTDRSDARDRRAARKAKAEAERKKPKKKPEPKFVRSETYVEVYNNSGITGLAATYASQATGVGWQVVGEDNWYGAIPASTVYYPERLQAAAKQLALDLGLSRTMPAVEPMNMDRLTVVLTADAA
ncbi:MAG TPA: LytR C-terminal domain-containing protein [Nocardioides sp.]